jgi:hypothetical protein
MQIFIAPFISDLESVCFKVSFIHICRGIDTVISRQIRECLRGDNWKLARTKKTEFECIQERRKSEVMTKLR